MREIDHAFSPWKGFQLRDEFFITQSDTVVIIVY